MIRRLIAGAALALMLLAILPGRANAQFPPPDVPPLTDADRAAAFPDVPGHEAHDNSVNYQVLFDRFEWQRASGTNDLGWDNTSWVGKDLSRLWLRTEGHTEDGAVADAQAQLLVGHSFARWWDVVAGVRQDVRPGSPQTWAAVGIQGLAPYWFAIEATGYVGASGRTHAKVDVEYELLVTNRLVLQPLVEVDMYGKRDPERRVGAGLSSVGAGLRLRYEFMRELAPYFGLTWDQKFGETGDFAKADGQGIRSLKFATGIRWWF
ncbi:MAG: copper resistance protein B [Vicinamibacterales bacterium]